MRLWSERALHRKNAARVEILGSAYLVARVHVHAAPETVVDAAIFHVVVGSRHGQSAQEGLARVLRQAMAAGQAGRELAGAGSRLHGAGECAALTHSKPS